MKKQEFRSQNEEWKKRRIVIPASEARRESAACMMPLLRPAINDRATSMEAP
ncbi:MAG: hypothetical protein NTW14_12010 [bacterium]|nr:hypothetical protein [bacterium]